MFKFLLLMCLSGSAFLSGQAIRIEAIPASVETVLALDEPNALKIDTVLKLCYSYIFVNTDTCIMLAEHAVALSASHFPGDTIHAESLLFLGDAHRVRNEWEKAEAALTQGKAVASQLGLEKHVASADLKLGAVSIRVEKYEHALEYLFGALEIWERLKDSSNIYKPWFEIAEVFDLLNQPRKALEYNQKALEWGIRINAPVMTMYALNNRAILQTNIAKGFQAATDTITVPGDSNAAQDSTNRYRLLALETYEKALPMFREHSRKRDLAEILSNLSVLKSDLYQYDEAMELAQEVVDISERINAPEFALSSNINLARIYRKSGKPQKAVMEAEKGLVNPAGKKNAVLLSNLHHELYLSYKAIGNYTQALKYYELDTDFKEKNEAAERNEVVATIEAKYQTAQQEKQILELNVANTAIKRQRNLYLFSAFGLTLFGFLGFQLTKVRRERNRKTAFTEALVDGQEEERKRIARDLHDGIGQSLLVIKRQLDNNRNSTIESRKLISSTLEEVRSISRNLHPVLLEQFGITATINDIVTRLEVTEPGLFVTSEIAEIDGLLLPKAEVQVFRVVQEALSNVVKHAEATAVRVTVERQSNTVVVQIQDNGKGFDYELAVVRSRSLGLRTMSERMTTVGGNLRIKAGEVAGTIVRLQLPIKKDTAAKELK